MFNRSQITKAVIVTTIGVVTTVACRQLRSVTPIGKKCLKAGLIVGVSCWDLVRSFRK